MIVYAGGVDDEALTCPECDWRRPLAGTESRMLVDALLQVHSMRPGHTIIDTPEDRSSTLSIARDD